MGRAGGGGGSHSSGGGGSSHRSSGGRIGGGSSRSGYSGSGHSRGGGGSTGNRSVGNRPMGGGYMEGHPMGGGHHGYGRHGYGHPSGYMGCGGCLSSVTGMATAIVALVVAIVFSAMIAFSNTSGSNTSSITKSTVERTPLDSSYVVETGYCTDELGWIENASTLMTGMKHFYEETGVQPYLYITDTVNGTNSPTEDDFETYGDELYSRLFEDEAHLLLIFYEYDSAYSTWYVCGAQAKTVIDSEAADILLDYIDSYYYSDMTDEEMFGQAFYDAADRIMTVTRPQWPIVIAVLLVLVIIAVLFMWWRAQQKQKNIEAEQTKQILNTPLETFGSTDGSAGDKADELAKKYR